MRGSIRPFLIAFALALATAVSAFPADTGSISGAVFDQAGQPASGATVRVAGDRLPKGRVVETGANGTYEFEYLVPGDYIVQIDRPGLGSATRAVVVELGKDTKVDIALAATISEEVTVTAAQPIVDVRSSEVSFNFNAGALNAVPLERTYRGLMQLIPGVADNRSPIGSAAGGTRQDNTYLIDGANITNPAFGYLGAEVNALDIAEVNIKRAGISAEFGRAAGTVTNAVSRSGSNRFSGVGRFDWLPEGLVGGYTLPDDLLAMGVAPGAFRDALLTTTLGPAIGAGGPLIKNYAFFYGSARFFRETKWDRVNKVSTPLPDEERSGREFYGKLTAVPAASHLLNASIRQRPNHAANASIGAEFAPSVATTNDNSSRVATAEWSNFMSGSRSLNLRYLYMRENNEGVPVRALGYLPTFRAADPAAMGQYMDPAQANLTVGANQYTNIQSYRRHELRGTANQFFDLGKSSHALKVGGGYEFGEELLNRLANGWGTIVAITVNNVPALRARYFTHQPAQRGQGRTWSVFLQDEITIANRLSVNAGLLLNRDEFSQKVEDSGGCPSSVVLKGGAAVYESKGDRCNFLRFGFGDEIQPRLGASYQLRAGKGDKAYASWGRYYNMDQKSSGRSLAPARIFQTETVFDLNGQILSSGPLASTTGKMIDPDINAIYSDEVVVGYAAPLAAVYSLDVFFMSRQMKNFIDDVPSRRSGTAPNSGPFVAVNLPCATFAACQFAEARRTYRAFTVDLRRRLSREWTADVSYTWSRFEGNYDLDYSLASANATVFNTSSIIQDGPGTNVEDPNRFGPLFEDRPHVVKAFASYAPSQRVSLSSYLRIQSGAPWTARGRDWAGSTLNYLEPAGSHRNPTWANLDLMGAYRLPLSARAHVSFEARLLNVFDNQTRLSTDAQQFLDLRTVPAPPYFAPYLQPNPFFGTGNSFAPPRRLLVAVATAF